jgi:hypothetical protein
MSSVREHRWARWAKFWQIRSRKEAWGSSFGVVASIRARELGARVEAAERRAKESR